MTPLLPARAIWALGVTQIVGYGTMYYSFGVLAPSIATEFALPTAWLYAALAVALLVGGVLAPLAGRLADRRGAARLMSWGSVAASATLVGAGLSPSSLAFAACLVAMQAASGFVLYATAFAALVQAGGATAQRSITQLTLIAGFASTIFWPLTSLLLAHMSWHTVYLVFAALNFGICAPLHLWLGRLPAQSGAAATPLASAMAAPAPLQAYRRGLAFRLMVVGFAIEGFILSAVLMQVLPLLNDLGLAGEALLVTSLFGPAQVLSRLTNMMFGKGLSPPVLAVIAAALPPIAMATAAFTAPSLVGSILFAILFGLGSGLTSIVAGSLPLHLLGRDGYGESLGWLTAGRQIASAVSPFCIAMAMSWLGAAGSLWLLTSLGAMSVLSFAALAALPSKGSGGESRDSTT